MSPVSDSQRYEFTLRVGEALRIGSVVLRLDEVLRSKVKLLADAPRDVPIHRAEVHARLHDSSIPVVSKSVAVSGREQP